MCGHNIHRLLLKDGLSNEHFDQYKEYVRRRDKPTDIEKYQSKKSRDRNKELNKLRMELKCLKNEYTRLVNERLKIEYTKKQDIWKVQMKIETFKRGYELSNNPRINKLKSKLKKW